nr:hypothetical protein [Paracoccus saliphilus]
MNQIAKSRHLFHVIVLAVAAVLAAGVLLATNFGLPVLGLLGLALTIAVFTIMLAFTAGN